VLGEMRLGLRLLGVTHLQTNTEVATAIAPAWQRCAALKKCTDVTCIWLYISPSERVYYCREHVTVKAALKG
jgi:hypothetical protein